MPKDKPNNLWRHCPWCGRVTHVIWSGDGTGTCGSCRREMYPPLPPALKTVPDNEKDE